jgi:thiol-disulfide isomerase/thioredoxin
LNQRSVIFRWRWLRLSIVAAVAVVLSSMVVQAPPVEAQEPPSIVGSSPLPGLSGATGWINSPPLTAKQLRGKVVLVDFWTYSCINCLRAVPYVRAWADKYKDSGLVVIGVHTPEFDFEGQMPNVEKAVKKFGITYPVALDSNQAIWNAKCDSSTSARATMTSPSDGSSSC